MQYSKKFRAAHPKLFKAELEAKRRARADKVNARNRAKRAAEAKLKPKVKKEPKPKEPKVKVPKSEEDWEFGVPWHVIKAKTGAVFPPINRRQWCARWNKGTTPRWEHRKAIIQSLFTEQEYAWHEWAERRLKSLCDHNFVLWMGPAASAKTSDAAVQALEWWLEAPHESAVIVCSTTKEMLKKRIWGQIVHYHSILNQKGLGYLGELLDASCFIRWKAGDWKNGIAGVAVQDGPVDEAVNNIIGMHTTRILWILDEMQGVREAIMGAIPNLLKNPETAMLGMGNPDSFTSLLCRYAEPVDGWKSIQRFTPEWTIPSNGYKGEGRALFFDGRKSPAVLDPEWGKKHPWMINQEQIDAHLNSREVAGNENHPKFMTQSIGWPPSMGLESTVLDAAIIQTFHCADRAVWTDGFTKCASLDPAFNGGDDAVLTFGKRGFVKDPEGERWVIEFNEQIIVPIDGESSRPIHYQILDFCRAESERRGIRPEEFAIAATGEGGGLVSIFETEWGAVVGIEEGGSPSERIVDERGKTAKESYDTRASELCFSLRNFALGNGIRGLTHQIQKDLCARQTFYKGGKWCVEPKRGSKGRTDVSGKSAKGFKERMGYSPDHGDSGQILVAHCVLKGAEPSFGVTAPAKAENWSRAVKRDDSWESAYDQEQDWRSYAEA